MFNILSTTLTLRIPQDRKDFASCGGLFLVFLFYYEESISDISILHLYRDQKKGEVKVSAKV